jgi:hypothetical protein
MNNINTIINREFLASLEPCDDRWENYLTYYADWSGSIEEFCQLDKISWYDKQWVLFHNFLTIERQSELVCDFAEHVLPIFEAKYPDDDRPRKAIEAARSGDKEAAEIAAVGAHNASTWASHLRSELSVVYASDSAAHAAFFIAHANKWGVYLTAASAVRAAFHTCVYDEEIEYQVNLILKKLKEDATNEA